MCNDGYSFRYISLIYFAVRGFVCNFASEEYSIMGININKGNEGLGMSTSKKFAVLLRRGMGLKPKDGSMSMPEIDGEEEWREVLVLGKEQAVIGILERGIQLMPPENLPPKQLFLQYCMLSQKITLLNRKTDGASVKVAEMLEQEGFHYCILKGQGNALAYTDPSARMPGDIDVWVAATPKEVVAFARKKLPDVKPCYHHVEYVKCDGIEVELHYRPAFLNNPLHNSRLQRWFLAEAASQCSHRVELPNDAGAVNIPTDAFNRIFQMAHIMNHVIHEGVGIRQLMDYYFLLRKGFTPEEQQRDEQLLRRFGLYNIAAAVMYTLRQLFAIPVNRMIVPADSRRGQFLLKEVLEGGNFGRFNPQARSARTRLAKNVLRLRRDFRLVTMFPSECLSEPMFRLWHFFWRLWF